ncbi:hypothetical protein D9M68_963240 [compost metagenome]
MVPDLHRVAQVIGCHACAVVADAHPPAAIVRIRKGDVDLFGLMGKAVVHEVGDSAGKAVSGACQDLEQSERVRCDVVVVVALVGLGLGRHGHCFGLLEKLREVLR